MLEAQKKLIKGCIEINRIDAAEKLRGYDPKVDRDLMVAIGVSVEEDLAHFEYFEKDSDASKTPSEILSAAFVWDMTPEGDTYWRQIFQALQLHELANYINFYDETWEAIHESGHTPYEVRFVGSVVTAEELPWRVFMEMVKVIEYDPSYGDQHIRKDLVIIFTDGSRLERFEYDGSEKWVHVKHIMIPETTTEMKGVLS
jgi:hypothetical protein